MRRRARQRRCRRAPQALTQPYLLLLLSAGLTPDGQTLGTPIAVLVRNKDQRSNDYSEMSVRRWRERAALRMPRARRV